MTESTQITAGEPAIERVRRWDASRRAEIAVARGASEASGGRLDEASEWFARAAATAPHEPMPLPFLAASLRAVADDGEPTVWARLAELAPPQAAHARSVLARVDEILSAGAGETTLRTEVDLIMVLGYKLAEGGRPRDRLLRRLRSALDLAERMPRALVLLSGGAVGGTPRSEASVMAEYVRAAGLPPERILTERYSQDTLENIRYARQFVKDEAATSVALVSEGPHLTRASALLTLTGWFQRVVPYGGPGAGDLTPSERFATYRDALRLRGYRLPTVWSSANGTDALVSPERCAPAEGGGGS